jgi:hypothetical protein
VVEKELGFGEVQLLHKLCKVTYSRNPMFIWYNKISVACFVLLNINGSSLHRFICSYLVGG